MQSVEKKKRRLPAGKERLILLVICFLTVGGSLFLTVKKGQKTEKKN